MLLLVYPRLFFNDLLGLKHGQLYRLIAGNWHFCLPESLLPTGEPRDRIVAFFVDGGRLRTPAIAAAATALADADVALAVCALLRQLWDRYTRIIRPLALLVLAEESVLKLFIDLEEASALTLGHEM